MTPCMVFRTSAYNTIPRHKVVPVCKYVGRYDVFSLTMEQSWKGECVQWSRGLHRLSIYVRELTPKRRHVQRTGAVPSRYLQRAFAVPPTTCPYGGVRRTHGHILPAQSIYSELITGIHEKVIFNLTKHSENISANTAWCPRRLGLLRLHLVAEEHRRNNLNMALIIRERQRLQEERRVRQCWVRTFCWSWWADRFPPRLFGALTLRLGSISSLSWR